LQKFASKNDPEKEEKILRALHQISPDFSREILREIEDIAPLSETDLRMSSRTDFRDIYTLTIDGSDAKDLDDALSIKIL
jgi:ribonuclease R